MGVKGLQYYIENHCPFGIRQVSIVQMAMKHRAENNCVPILAVDGMSVLHRLYKMDDLEWLYGGQWKQYVENFKLFVQRFKDEGIEPVFIFDGIVENSKTREWIDRRIEKLKDVKKIFEHIVQYNTYPDERLSLLPASMATLIRYALKYECKCDVINSITDADKEIAMYAKNTRGCFAILSQDSDYIIFDTKPYLSVSHLKLGALETVEYDRVAFNLHLGLNMKLLPMIGCLMGNDYVHIDTVRAFHRFLTAARGRTTVQDIVPRLSEYIHSSGWNGNDTHTVTRIAENVGLSAESLRHGLNYYSLRNALVEKPVAAKHLLVPQVLDEIRERHRAGRINAQIYCLLSQLSYKSSECLEDERSTGLLPSAVIFRGLRLRMYYILLGTTDVEVEELSAIQGLPILMEKVKPDAFKVFGARVMPLKELWNPKSKIGWRTVVEAMGIKVPEYHMTGAAPHFQGFACLINYLLLNHIGEPRLAPWEVDALVAQAVSPMAQDLEGIRRLKVPFIEPRAIHLATIVLRGITTIVSFIQACAEPFLVKVFMPWYCFDGKLFHYLYLMAKAGATVEDLVFKEAKAVREFFQLRMMSVSGTYIVEERYKE